MSLFSSIASSINNVKRAFKPLDIGEGIKRTIRSGDVPITDSLKLLHKSPAATIGTMAAGGAVIGGTIGAVREDGTLLGGAMGGALIGAGIGTYQRTKALGQLDDAMDYYYNRLNPLMKAADSIHNKQVTKEAIGTVQKDLAKKRKALPKGSVERKALKEQAKGLREAYSNIDVSGTKEIQDLSIEASKLKSSGFINDATAIERKIAQLKNKTDVRKFAVDYRTREIRVADRARNLKIGARGNPVNINQNAP